MYWNQASKNKLMKIDRKFELNYKQLVIKTYTSKVDTSWKACVVPLGSPCASPGIQWPPLGTTILYYFVRNLLNYWNSNLAICVHSYRSVEPLTTIFLIIDYNNIVYGLILYIFITIINIPLLIFIFYTKFNMHQKQKKKSCFQL